VTDVISKLQLQQIRNKPNTAFTECQTYELRTNQNKALNGVRRRHEPTGKSSRECRGEPRCRTSPSLPATNEKLHKRPITIKPTIYITKQNYM